MKKTPDSPDNYDLFDGADEFASLSELPSLADLQRMYDIYNREYFDGKLPPAKIRYSKRMLVAGGYFPQKKEIRISEKYHTYFPDEVYDTLKHEMIHLIHFKHDAAFKKMARRIGASLRANEHPALRRPPRYLYICPHCNTAFKVDEAGYADILKQVRDREFEQQLNKRLALAEQDKRNAIELAVAKKDREMQTLEAQLKQSAIHQACSTAILSHQLI